MPASLVIGTASLMASPGRALPQGVHADRAAGAFDIKQEAYLDIGKYVIVRSDPSGCWAGTLASIDGTTVELTDARRLWRWWAGKGVSLNGVATHGLRSDKLNECLIGTPVARAMVMDVCEVLTATADARKSIEGQEATVT